MLLASALLGFGLILVIAEILFPSFGILGILATICVVGSVFVAFGESKETGMNFILVAGFTLPLAIVFGLKLLPRSPVVKHFIAGGFSFEDGDVSDERDKSLLGVTGKADSVLRPAGTAWLEGRRVDVVSRGEFIEAGESVRVVKLEGNRVVVARDEREA